MKFRKLEPSEIECRVSTIKANGLSLLLYKDARCDMNMLDEIVGAEYWTRDHKEVKGNVYCGVSIYLDLGENDKQWITKWDAGAESYTEKVKGEASDSFKRACFNWGIGRELYTAPFIWIKPKNADEIVCTNPEEKVAYKKKYKLKYGVKFNVSAIAYENDAISYLTISDESGAIRYNFGTSNTKVSKNTLQQLIDLNIAYNDMLKWADYYNVKYEETSSVESICKGFNEEQAQFIISRFNKQGGKQ